MSQEDLNEYQVLVQWTGETVEEVEDDFWGRGINMDVPYAIVFNREGDGVLNYDMEEHKDNPDGLKDFKKHINNKIQALETLKDEIDEILEED